MGSLTSIHSKLFKYIKAIAEVIDLDIYIVDNKLLRVVGTGVYNKMLGIVLPENTSNGWVLKTKKPLFMFDPLKNEICQECPMKKSDNCGKEYSIHMPIILEGNCLGVVTISSYYDDESKRRIIDEKDRLTKFNAVMAEAITKLVESELKIANYEKLLSSTEEAIIITDKEGEIIQTTDVIKKNFGKFHNVYELISKTKASYGDDFRGSNFKINDNLQVNRVKVDLGGNDYNQMFFLKMKNENRIDEIEGFIDKELFLGQIVGKSEILEEIKKVVLHVAKYDSNCLILGESGTGKEMFAKLIHNISDRRDKPFVPINCAAIPDHLIESEIFGYEAGAFTDASKKGKKGLFEVADHGTIFLDEIGDMPIYLQPKLLRVLETGKITRIGSTKDIQLDVRFIAATNKNLSEEIKNGQFRDDLYYRLCVIPLKLPALRERTEDIIELTRYFIEKYNNKFGKNIKKISDKVKKYLLIYDWPGNVRELENVIEYAITMERTDTLTTSSFPLNINYSSDIRFEGAQEISINDFKKQNISNLVEKYGNTVESKTRIAQELGISLSTLYRYLKKYKL